MSIKHIVLLNWKDNTTAEQSKAVASSFDALKAELGDLPISFQFGPNAQLMKGNADFSIVAEFSTEADLMTYANHPTHRKIVKELFGTILDSIQHSQFLIE